MRAEEYMKETGPLRVRGVHSLPENRLNIHPNEGADLGLMTTRYSVDLDGTGPSEIFLLNECPPETIEINSKKWEKLGKPSKAKLAYEEGKLYIRKV